MTDRYFSLTVALQKDIREDDAGDIIRAIEMIKGVLTVSGNVSDSTNWVAEMRAKSELKDKLWKAIDDRTD